ncbi:DUF1801 domain-containing protein [Chitinimonas viridis]|uniref:DUF1801 domain-containing protein n=1 Tax=Chitinimonas viridis TaxID=664880 RepID=A0ABT8BAZ2_9NEIS|nr:DUF1801 domain-containing protein [Chitinimonas viridis]MDN3578741.1 DUF1801 domain-containing protein [Chitinimonas viridis]
MSSTTKTRPSGETIAEFLAGIGDPQRQADCRTLTTLMQEISGYPPVIWASSMVGFGQYHYRYASGHEGDMFMLGFSPRKQDLTLYLLAGFDEHAPLLARLGKHRLGKSCLYLKSLAQVDMAALRELVTVSLQRMHALQASTH